ncbi:MAG: hypothetical protein IIA77_11940, partial [Proteobacteria bacterium]|nr:hypothetical protein [Pseudomonadota bacterium]
MLDKIRDKQSEAEESVRDDSVCTGTPGTPGTLEETIQTARDALIEQQQADGHWVYQLEADCTIPAEYILMNHFADEIDDELESKIAVYIREHQADH